jgi:hypothetical protein
MSVHLTVYEIIKQIGISYYHLMRTHKKNALQGNSKVSETQLLSNVYIF